jgi:hypothetical protein
VIYCLTESVPEDPNHVAPGVLGHPLFVFACCNCLQVTAPAAALEGPWAAALLEVEIPVR